MAQRKLKKALFYLLPFITVSFGIYVVKNVWFAMLGYHFFAILILVIEKQGQRMRQLFMGGTASGLILSIFAGLSSGVLLYYLSQFISLPENFSYLLKILGLDHHSWLLFILYYSLINPIIEELYWRGYLGSESDRFTWSDIGYAGYHPLVFLRFVAWPWALIEFVFLLGMAWIWRMAVKKYQGLLLPFMMHLAADLSIGLAIYFLAV